MNRELFIGAIDLTKHVYKIDLYIPVGMFGTRSYKGRLQGYEIWINRLDDAMIYNLKQMCTYRPLPSVFFSGIGFKIQLSDFNDYSLKLCDSVSAGIELVLIFEQEFKTYTMQGRFGR